MRKTKLRIILSILFIAFTVHAANELGWISVKPKEQASTEPLFEVKSASGYRVAGTPISKMTIKDIENSIENTFGETPKKLLLTEMEIPVGESLIKIDKKRKTILVTIEDEKDIYKLETILSDLIGTQVEFDGEGEKEFVLE